MAIQATKFIWQNGALKPWEDATTHVSAHALHYGSSVFEGIRVYETPAGSQVFRLAMHTERLFDAAKVYRMEIPYSREEINEACKMVVRENGLTSAYVRPLIYRGTGNLAVAPTREQPVDVAILAFAWGRYLGAEGIEQGVDVCVSSWNRVAPNTIPSMVKGGGGYLSGQLITMEAQRLGFVEGIALAPDGTISEGAGENVFVIRNGSIFTPPLSASVLPGITRDTAITLARDLGLTVVEQALPREILYLASEVFLTGTAAEITPVRSVDRVPVGSGGRGPVTEKIQKAFFGLFNGETEDKRGWLGPVGG